MRKLGRGYCFTKIDLANAYNQICLSPDSQRSWLSALTKEFYFRKDFFHIFRKSPSHCYIVTSLHAKVNSGSGVKKKLHFSKSSNGYYAQRLFLPTMTYLSRWVYLVTPQNAELERYYFIALQTEASVRFSIFLKFYWRHKDATAKYRKKHYP